MLHLATFILQVCAILSSAVVHSSEDCIFEWQNFRHYPHTFIPSVNGTVIQELKTHDVNTLKKVCSESEDCRAFNTLGQLFGCSGCEHGQGCCKYSGPLIPSDLYVKRGQLIPPEEWRDAIERASYMYSNPEPADLQDLHPIPGSHDGIFSPFLGNGFIGGPISSRSDVLYVAGFFNGHCGNNRSRMSLPSPLAVIITNANNTGSALDLEMAVVRRRWSGKGFVVEQRFYIHRTRKNILVQEFELLHADNANDIIIQIEAIWDNASPTRGAGSILFQSPRPLNMNLSNGTCTFSGPLLDTYFSHEVGESFTSLMEAKAKCVMDPNCAGITQEPSGDAPFQLRADPTPKHSSGREISYLKQPPGCLNETFTTYIHEAMLPNPRMDGQYNNITMIVDDIPSSFHLSKASPIKRFLSVVSVSTENENNSTFNTTAKAITEYIQADGVDKPSLFKEHCDAWHVLWSSRIEILGHGSRAYDVAADTNNTIYRLMSHFRHDVAQGSPPGGLYNNLYGSNTFWDMDSFMLPAMLLIAPELSRAGLQYRYNMLGFAKIYAMWRNYSGAMFPFVTGWNGDPNSDCDGHSGSGVEKFEQHTTVDVGVSFWLYWLATGNKTWLENIASPVLNGVAEWIVSRVKRVSKNGTADEKGRFHGILHIEACDEWGGKGIDNSLQLNSWAKACLIFANMARNLTGRIWRSDWEAISDTMLIPFNISLQTHLNRPGFNLSHGNPKKGHNGKVCPAEGSLVTYPLSAIIPSLNVTEVIARNDALIANILDCHENPGMTAGMHVAALVIGNVLDHRLEFQYNRSLSSVYGPYFIRNENDIHSYAYAGNGSYDTAHALDAGRAKARGGNFLTGDGGAFQGVVFGLLGLNLAMYNGSPALRILNPTLLPGIDGMRFIGLQWQRSHIDYEIKPKTFSLSLVSGDKIMYICNNKTGVLHIAISLEFSIVTGQACYLILNA